MSMWDDNLTDAQKQTVQIAARAASDQVNPSAWVDNGYEFRMKCCGQMLAALRESGHPLFPKPKAPSRGEVIAAAMVPECLEAILVNHPTAPHRTITLLQSPGCSGTAGLLREYIAAAIDPEIARVVDAAAKLVTDAPYHGSRTELAKSILALKGGAK